MSRSPSRPSGPPKHHAMLWCLGLVALGGGVSAILWAPPERAALLLSLAGLVITAATAWWGPRGRR